MAKKQVVAAEVKKFGAAPPDVSFCKQTEPLVKVTLSGTALKIEGFGFPQQVFAVHYVERPDTIPAFPNSSGTVGGIQEANVVDTSNGNWDELTLVDICNDEIGDPPQNLRTVVVWYRYENEFDIYWLLEVFTIEIPLCGDENLLPCDV
jgi:hypothetical protein